MPSVRVDVDFDEIGRILRAEGSYSGVRDDLTRRMQSVLAVAVATAPVGETGEHKASIRIEQDTTDRAVVRVVADSDHSAGVEANTGHLARSLDAAGGG